MEHPFEISSTLNEISDVSHWKWSWVALAVGVGTINRLCGMNDTIVARYVSLLGARSRREKIGDDPPRGLLSVALALPLIVATVVVREESRMYRIWYWAVIDLERGGRFIASIPDLGDRARRLPTSSSTPLALSKHRSFLHAIFSANC